jgi:hypothetical protein
MDMFPMGDLPKNSSEFRSLLAMTMLTSRLPLIDIARCSSFDSDPLVPKIISSSSFPFEYSSAIFATIFYWGV